MSTLQPTGNCFDDAISIMNEMLAKDAARVWRGDYLLCHGICIASVPEQRGERVAHAWVEHGDHVLTAGFLNGELVKARIARTKFYDDCAVVEVTRYTAHDIRREQTRTGYGGPWKPEYRALCADLRGGLQQ